MSIKAYSFIFNILITGLNIDPILHIFYTYYITNIIFIPPLILKILKTCEVKSWW